MTCEEDWTLAKEMGAHILTSSFRIAGKVNFADFNMKYGAASALLVLSTAGHSAASTSSQVKGPTFALQLNGVIGRKVKTYYSCQILIFDYYY